MGRVPVDTRFGFERLPAVVRDVGRRLLMGLVGIHLLAGYLLLAYAAYWALSWLVLGRSSLVETALLLALLTALFGYLSYRYGTRRLLAGLDATPISREVAPTLHRILDRLSAAAGVDPPAVAVADLEAPNALAVGGADSGVLVLDRRLFGLLTRAEMAAILAHELAHLESHDSLVQTVAYSAVRTLVGLVMVLLSPALLALTGFARGLAWIRGRPDHRGTVDAVRGAVESAVVAVLLSLTLVVRAHSRRREFAADDRAVELTGDPVALARALRKIDRASRPGWGLLSPLYVRGDEEEDALTRLLSTHPDVDDRIDRLLDRGDGDEGGRRIPIQSR